MLSLLRRTAWVLFVWSLAGGVSDVEGRTHECVSAGGTCLDAVDDSPLSNRTPLILVHGWNRDSIPAPATPTVWNNLVDYWTKEANSDLNEAFKLYTLSYRSNELSLTSLAMAFRDVIDKVDGSDPAFGGRNRPLAIVAHSMGGLISRRLLDLSQVDGPNASTRLGERVVRVITLATPHHGTPLANGPALLSKAGLEQVNVVLFNVLFYLVGGPTWYQLNRFELRWDNYYPLFDYGVTTSEPDNEWLMQLNASTVNDRKIVAYAGGQTNDPIGEVCLIAVYCYGNAVLRGLFGPVVGDGVVPLSSAAFLNTAGLPRADTARLFARYNHEEMHNGKGGDNVLFDQLKEDLLAVQAPGSPTSLTASAGATTVSLSWSAPSSGGDLSGYIIEAGSSSGSVDLAVDTGNRTTEYHSGAIPAGTYFVRVRAKGRGGIGPPSNEKTVRLGGGCTTPTAPTGLSREIESSTVSLSWRPPSSGTPLSYVIEAGSGRGLSDIVGSFDTGSVATSLTAPGLASRTYYVRVRAKNACGLGPASDDTTFTIAANPNPLPTPVALPSAPQDVTGSSSGNTITVRWQPPATGAPITNYVVRAGRSSGVYDLFSGSVGAVTSVSESVGAGSYYVSVAAQNATGVGLPSTEIKVAVGVAVPPTPTPTPVPSDWILRSSSSSPPGPLAPVMAYDARRGQVVLFGGGAQNSNPSFRETWVWDGTTWAQKSTAVNSRPVASLYAAMVYDPVREQTVFFGGYDAQGNASNETWVWDGTTWAQKNPANSPTRRYFHAMAYDASRGQVVLFGGAGSDGALLNDTWVWDGTTWTQKNPANSPLRRASHAMAYDAARAQVVLFGGSSFDNANGRADTWVWDGSTWTQKNPANSPPLRLGHAMAYDAVQTQVILFGGTGDGNGNDTWVWDGVNWTRQNPAHRPRGRYHHVMTFDAGRAQIVLFGGDYPGSIFNETWVWPGPAGSGAQGALGALEAMEDVRLRRK